MTEIREWMSDNLLKLNKEKPDFMMFWSCHRPLSLQDYIINIGQSKLTPAKYVKKLDLCYPGQLLVNAKDE